MENITYNQIIQEFQNLANAHLQVKTFTQGDIFEVDANTVVFPQVHLITEQAIIKPQEITYNFKLIAMDLVEPAEENEIEVLSDTLRIIGDFVSAFRNGAGSGSVFPMEPDLYDISEQINCNPFTERFDQSVSGWVADFQITVVNDESMCDSAFDGLFT